MTTVTAPVFGPRHAPAQVKPMSASDGVKPPRAFRCSGAGCRAVVYLYEFQPLPLGWQPIELYVHRTAGQFRAAEFTYKCAACAAAEPRRRPMRKLAQAIQNGERS